MAGTGPFPEQPAAEWDLAGFGTAGEAYQHLMHGLMQLLKASIDLVRQGENIIFALAALPVIRSSGRCSAATIRG